MYSGSFGKSSLSGASCTPSSGMDWPCAPASGIISSARSACGMGLSNWFTFSSAIAKSPPVEGELPLTQRDNLMHIIQQLAQEGQVGFLAGGSPSIPSCAVLLSLHVGMLEVTVNILK